MMRARWAKRVGGASVFVLAAACGDDGGGGSGGGDHTATAAHAARDYLASLDRQALSFEEVLRRFDVNGDGVVDAKDVDDLKRCVDAKANVDNLACDVVPDGAIDQADAFALSVALGEHHRVAPDRLAGVVAALRSNARADWQPALVGTDFDWTNDGLLDAADVAVLADYLGGDLAPFDLNGDGTVDLRDVNALAERQAQAQFSGGAAPAADLNRDGASDVKDLVLLAELALYTADARPGWFDTDLDGKIDEGDFCRVTASPNQTSYYGLLMPKAAADAAFAASTPRFSVCRADGRPIARNRARFDTQQIVKLAPSNLFLQPVTEVPAGYAPADPSLATGRQLYVVSTTPSAHPVLSIRLPWNVTLAGGNDVSLRLGGEALPENASLVLPGSIAPLAKPAASRAARNDQPASDVIVPLPDLAAGDDAAAAAELIANLAVAKQTYETLIAGCPCSLTPQERDALVSWLLRAGSCLETTLASAKSKLAAAELLEAQLSRHATIANNGSAGYHELLQENYLYMELVSALFLVAEVGYDTASGGLGNALGNQLSNLVSEELGPDTSREGYADGVAQDALVSTALTPGSQAVDTLATMFNDATLGDFKHFAKNPQELKDFINKELKGDKFRAGATIRAEIEAVIKAAIKRLPKDLIREQRINADRIEHEATEYAAAHRAAMLAAANLRYAVRALESSKDSIRQLREALLAKLQADGCGVTVRPTNPCAFDLQSAIDAAGQDLATAAAAAQADLDRARAGGGNASSEETCNGSRSAITRTELDVATLAREMSSMTGGEKDAAIKKLEADMIKSVEEASSESQDLGRFACLLSFDTNPEDIDAIHAAELAMKKALDDYQKKVDEAHAAYEACGDGGACGFDAGLSPWAAGAKCLGCVPTYAMNCCGDGKAQPGEECDPGSPGVACAEVGQVCSGTCTCSSSSYGQPDATNDLLTNGGDPAGAFADPGVDIARSETYFDAEFPTSPWVRVVVAGAFPPSTTFYSWFVRLTLYDAGMTSVGSFTVERHNGNDAQIVTVVPPASVSYMAEANGFRVRFAGPLAPTQYTVESGILKVSSGGTFVRDSSGPHAFVSTAAPW